MTPRFEVCIDVQAMKKRVTSLIWFIAMIQHPRSGLEMINEFAVLALVMSADCFLAGTCALTNILQLQWKYQSLKIMIFYNIIETSLC